MSTARIVSIDYNPPGDDVAGEHVVVRNTGAATLDLSGWTISDAAPLRPHVFQFSQVQVPPRGEVRVWTRAGSNTASDLYWNLGSAVWNNPGDTAVLRDAQGAEADRYSYLPAPTTAERLRLVVPAFWDLGSRYQDDWEKLKQAGSAVSISVIQGEWPATAQGNPAWKAQAQAHLDTLQGLKLGYVGTRDADKALLDADTILARAQGWYDHFGAQIAGIYFDELVLYQDPDTADAAFAMLRRFKTERPAARVMILAGQSRDERVLTSPDVDWAVMWEQEFGPYRDFFYPMVLKSDEEKKKPILSRITLGVSIPPWWKDPAHRSKIVHVVHNCTEPERQRALGLANERNAGNVFVMDLRGPNSKGEFVLYDHLPDYWDLEVREANSYTDFGFEPRLVLLAARRYGVAEGKLHAWPNFEAVWYGTEHRRGTFLLDAGAERRDVPALELGVPLYDVSGVWRAAHAYAQAQGFETAIPTFEQVDSPTGPRYTLMLFPRGLPWLVKVTVPVAETYQQASFSEPGSVIRNVSRWASAQGYRASFPTFVPTNPDDPRGKWTAYNAYALTSAAPVSWVDVSTTEYLRQL